jgi:hypothetical protein
MKNEKKAERVVVRDLRVSWVESLCRHHMNRGAPVLAYSDCWMLQDKAMQEGMS